MKGPREAADREHFNSIADGYAAKDLAPSSRIARRHRLDRTLAAVPADTFERVLEVGCGAGFGADYLRGRFEDYVGIDHSRRLIEVAIEKNSGTGVRFEASSIDGYDPPHRFDLIVMIGVLHHLEDPARSMETMVPWLEPGGYLVANEPQPANPLIRAARQARTRFDASYSSEQEEFRDAELRALFEVAGLEGISITPQGLVSTPFSELVLKPYAVTTPLARIACAVDGLIERRSGPWLGAFSWNLIGCGRAPTSSKG